MFKKHKTDQNFVSSTIARLYENIPLVKKIRRRRRLAATIRIVSLVVFTLAFVMVSILAYLLHSVEQIISDSQSGVEELTTAFTTFESGDYTSALVLSSTAKSRFDANTAFAKSQSEAFVFRNLDILRNELGALYKFNSSLSQITEILAKASGIGRNFDLSLDKEAEIPIWRKLYDSLPGLKELNSDIENAQADIAGLGGNSFLIRKTTVDKIADELAASKQKLESLMPVAEITPKLLGYPEEKNFLIVLSDPRIKRPHGGYMEYFALAKVKNGVLDSLLIDTPDEIDDIAIDSYYASPPDSLAEFADEDNFRLEDANYSPDWSVVASKLMHMYTARTAGRDSLYSGFPKGIYSPEQIDGVFAFPLDLIFSLMDLVGTFNLDGIEYNGVLLEQQLFADATSQSGTAANKELLKRIIYRIQNKFIGMKIDNWVEISDLLHKEIEKGNMRLYFRDEEAENVIKKYTLNGSLSQVNSDYLDVVDYALDEDNRYALERFSKFKLDQGANGIFVDLTLSYVRLDKDSGNFRDYLRIYVPAGSELAETEGLDSAVATIDELGKTSFGALLEIAQGEQRTVSFRYKLPDRIGSFPGSKRYDLVIQKPNFTEDENYVVDLSFMNSIRLYRPTGFNIDNSGKNIVWQSELGADSGFSVYFE